MEIKFKIDYGNTLVLTIDLYHDAAQEDKHFLPLL